MAEQVGDLEDYVYKIVKLVFSPFKVALNEIKETRTLWSVLTSKENTNVLKGQKDKGLEPQTSIFLLHFTC